MADVLSAFRSLLLQSADLVEHVADRINSDVLPQDEPIPAIAIRRISTRHEQNIRGSKAGMATTRIEVDCFATTRAVADSIAESVRLSGVLDHLGVHDGIDFRGIVVDSGLAQYTETNNDGSHELRYVSSLDFEVVFLEAT